MLVPHHQGEPISDLIAVAYPEANRAKEVLLALKRLQKEYLIEARRCRDLGATTEVTFEGRVDYYPFRLAENAPAVRHARRAAEWITLKSSTKFSHGGLDANWFAKHGLPTVTIGAGPAEIHTVKEFVELPEFANGCRLAMATLES